MLVKPRPSAQPSSRSIVARSKVLACHISSWLIAVLGAKLQPTSQGCSPAHAWALATGQGPGSVGGAATRVGVKTRVSAKASAAVIRPRIGRLIGRSIVSDAKDENRLADRDERSLRGSRSKNQPDAPW